MKRRGVLLPVFSLPGPYGIGGLGEEAYRFVEFLAKTGHNYWQVLPIGPTSYGDSPYQSPSLYAGNPYFIDLDILCEDGLLTREECDAERTASRRIVYARLYRRRYAVLRRAYTRFLRRIPDSFAGFLSENEAWLKPYCRFMEGKEKYGGKPWTEWPEKEYPEKQAYEEVNFRSFMQYEFFTQWQALKRYANGKGVKIIGDMPIYAALDSADVWSAPQYFQLTDSLMPEAVAGVPSDAFSADGQLWGNPLYRWEALEKDGFRWWLDRFRHSFALFDALRIDHFHGFAAYYAVPYGATTAYNGEWVKAPGEKLFEKVVRKFPGAEILAENLGYLDTEARRLLHKTGFPGMKVAQFGFDEPLSEYLPARYPENCVAYTGTHDNMTARQWAKTLSEKTLKKFRRTVGKRLFENDAHALVRSVLESDAGLTVIPIQDYLETGAEGRINTPSTLGNNWTWRMDGDYEKSAKKIARLMRVREKEEKR